MNEILSKDTSQIERFFMDQINQCGVSLCTFLNKTVSSKPIAEKKRISANRRAVCIEGEIIVAIPSRDVLLVTDSSSEIGMQGIRKATAEAMQSAAYRLTDRLFIRRNSQFVPI